MITFGLVMLFVILVSARCGRQIQYILDF